MKTLVVYYSRDGNTRFVANKIANEMNAEVLEIKPKKPYSEGGLGMFIGGMEAMIKKEPEIIELDKNPFDYEMIIIGTPTWAGRPSPPIRSFLGKYRLKNKKIALFSSCGTKATVTFQEMKKELLNNELLGQLELVKPLENKDETEKKLKEWLKELKGKII